MKYRYKHVRYFAAPTMDKLTTTICYSIWLSQLTLDLEIKSTKPVIRIAPPVSAQCSIWKRRQQIKISCLLRPTIADADPA